MCLGIPGKVVSVGDSPMDTAQIEVCGVRRDVNIALVCDGKTLDMLGKWVLVHVGFAMSIIDEQEAQDTLEALMAMESVEEDVAYFLRGNA
ncbi:MULTISPECIES: hydrogenase maturation factor HybG [Providencia]|uniref:HybG family [NiFe] hydrogenase metallocenter assembly protein n=1 Tax=Providencia heimbachae ATCC 35613 TaxID=1354272 RepID=A0A1B7JLE4_9GAMM|nr:MULTISPECIES: hydrogenase maturation factor HybG [Providencia]MBP6124105.1 hydrogenase maturation factor HybG [Providencia sp.]NIH21895.1 hydrogenase maturation factor HybG [Providencia heimbachae]OAT48725.1 HybG family [NiFe] hydrogenase metallocenter assembly protein [Providencia heimbachae ATCC 35613]QCJ69393.1 HypC/HybG/HupF family hydrogenase formation chaperone [Providencia heimbachae]SQH12447.1 Hydrogenase isoenzymes formation protein hypC [Providencia heimbachae]